MKQVLILCTGNSCRSIMAEALINSELSKDCDIKAYSSGVNPLGKINEKAIAVLKENKIDTSGLYSKNLDEVMCNDYDLIITVCDHAKEVCPVFPRDVRTIHMGFEDPSDKDLSSCMETFEEIKRKLLPIVKEELFE